MEEKPSLDQIFHAIKLDPSLATPSMLRKIVFDYEYEYGYDYDDGVLDILKLRPDIDPKPIVQGLIDVKEYKGALKYIKEFNLNKDDFKWPEKLDKVAASSMSDEDAISIVTALQSDHCKDVILQNSPVGAILGTLFEIRTDEIGNLSIRKVAKEKPSLDQILHAIILDPSLATQKILEKIIDYGYGYDVIDILKLRPDIDPKPLIQTLIDKKDYYWALDYIKEFNIKDVDPKPLVQGLIDDKRYYGALKYIKEFNIKDIDVKPLIQALIDKKDYNWVLYHIKEFNIDIDYKPLLQKLIDEKDYGWALSYIKEFNLNKDDFKWPEKLEKVAEEKPSLDQIAHAIKLKPELATDKILDALWKAGSPEYDEIVLDIYISRGKDPKPKIQELLDAGEYDVYAGLHYVKKLGLEKEVDLTKAIDELISTSVSWENEYKDAKYWISLAGLEEKYKDFLNGLKKVAAVLTEEPPTIPSIPTKKEQDIQQPWYYYVQLGYMQLSGQSWRPRMIMITRGRNQIEADSTGPLYTKQVPLNDRGGIPPAIWAKMDELLHDTSLIQDKLKAEGLNKVANFGIGTWVKVKHDTWRAEFEGIIKAINSDKTLNIYDPNADHLYESIDVALIDIPTAKGRPLAPPQYSRVGDDSWWGKSDVGDPNSKREYPGLWMMPKGHEQQYVANPPSVWHELRKTAKEKPSPKEILHALKLDPSLATPSMLRKLVFDYDYGDEIIDIFKVRPDIDPRPFIQIFIQDKDYLNTLNYIKELNIKDIDPKPLIQTLIDNNIYNWALEFIEKFNIKDIDVKPLIQTLIDDVDWDMEYEEVLYYIKEFNLNKDDFKWPEKLEKVAEEKPSLDEILHALKLDPSLATQKIIEKLVDYGYGYDVIDILKLRPDIDPKPLIQTLIDADADADDDYDYDTTLNYIKEFNLDPKPIVQKLIDEKDYGRALAYIKALNLDIDPKPLVQKLIDKEDYGRALEYIKEFKVRPDIDPKPLVQTLIDKEEYYWALDYIKAFNLDPKLLIQKLIDDNIYNWALKYIKEFNLNKDDFKWPEKLEKVAEEKKKVCAWCNKVIKEGTEPASHTICPDCSKKELEKRKQRVSDDVLHSNLLEKIVKEYNEEVAIEVDKYLCGEIKEPSRELYSVLTKIGIARLA